MPTKTRKTLSHFAKNASQSERLIRAVVSQLGGWDYFKESANDIANHGADGGWSGFTYFADTCAFAKRNRAHIAQSLEWLGDDVGRNALDIVAGFNCLKNCHYTTVDVGKVLFGKHRDSDTEQMILNALAWHALEEVARAYVDYCENDSE